jgi:hypothetical protein
VIIDAIYVTKHCKLSVNLKGRDMSGWSLSDWILCILNPILAVGIHKKDVHLFQNFVSIASNILWFHRNRPGDA